MRGNEEQRWEEKVLGQVGQRMVLLLWVIGNPEGSQTINQFGSVKLFVLIPLRTFILFLLFLPSYIKFLDLMLEENKKGEEG